jgi:hypothetical protein
MAALKLKSPYAPRSLGTSGPFPPIIRFQAEFDALAGGVAGQLPQLKGSLSPRPSTSSGRTVFSPFVVSLSNHGIFG